MQVRDLINSGTEAVGPCEDRGNAGKGFNALWH